MKKYFVMLFTFLALLIVSSPAFAEEDKEPPTLDSIKLLTPKVVVGGKVQLQLTVSDDVSGLQEVRAHYVTKNGKEGVVLQKTFSDTALNKTFILEQEITKELGTGEWRLTMVQIRDHRGRFDNIIDKEYDFSKTSFTVTAPVDDTTKTSSEKVKVKDEFKALKAKTNVPLTGEMSFTFNTLVSPTTFTKKNVYVLDAKGKNVPLLFVIEPDAKTKKSTITIAPLENYSINSAYTLYIKNIIGKDNKTLKQYTKTQFTTKK